MISKWGLKSLVFTTRLHFIIINIAQNPTSSSWLQSLLPEAMVQCLLLPDSMVQCLLLPDAMVQCLLLRHMLLFIYLD